MVHVYDSVYHGKRIQQRYISKILCPKIVLDSASTRYSLQTKLDSIASNRRTLY